MKQPLGKQGSSNNPIELDQPETAEPVTHPSKIEEWVQKYDEWVQRQTPTAGSKRYEATKAANDAIVAAKKKAAAGGAVAVKKIQEIVIPVANKAARVADKFSSVEGDPEAEYEARAAERQSHMAAIAQANATNDYREPERGSYRKYEK